MALIEQLNKIELNKLTKNKIPSFTTGNILRIKFLISKKKRKKQTFIGICIAKRNRGINSSVTIRNTILKEGFELTFPLYSPLIEIEVLSSLSYGHRSKLYYLRNTKDGGINKNILKNLK